MGLFDYFKPVPAMAADEVIAFIKERGADAYNLVDVRQPEPVSSGGEAVTLAGGSAVSLFLFVVGRFYPCR